MPSDTSPPALDGTVETNQKCCAWVFAELAAGNIDPRVADSLTAAAKAELNNIAKHFTMHEMDELRELVRRAEAANAEWKHREQQERRTASDGTQQTLGRVRVDS